MAKHDMDVFTYKLQLLASVSYMMQAQHLQIIPQQSANSNLSNQHDPSFF